MSNNLYENDMLLMNEALREAIGDMSPKDSTEDQVELVKGEDVVLKGIYRSVKTSVGMIGTELQLEIANTDKLASKSSLFLVGTQCDQISLGNDVILDGGIIDDISVSKSGSQFIITVNISNYQES